MQLYLTPLSHFARKVRILLDSYPIPYEVIDLGNIIEPVDPHFGGNPLSRVPVLKNGEDWLIDSDHIAEYIVSKFDPSDRFRVRCRSLMEYNIRAVLNGIMAEEVTHLIATRMGVPTQELQFFQDALDSIHQGLLWLEKNSGAFDRENPGYQEFHLVCALEHLHRFDFISTDFKNSKLKDLNEVASKVALLPAVKPTSPWVLRPKK